MIRCILSVLVSIAAIGTIAAQPVNDRFSSAVVLSGPQGRATGTSVRATKELGEPDHVNGGGSASVWWRWSSPVDGGVSFDTFSSSFDTVLAVYTGSSVNRLSLVVQNDDLDDGFVQSTVSFAVTEGQEYFLAVDGYDTAAGSVVLNWRSVDTGGSCIERPDHPLPANEARVDGASVDLVWNAKPKARRVIYGNDDRREIYDVKDASLLAAWDSTVALVSRRDLEERDNDFRLVATTTYADEYDVCASERFAEQPNPAWCSGFLVGRDLVITAGHCVFDQTDCDATAFVFGYRMLDEDRATLQFAKSEVYFCKEVVARHLDDDAGDWALIRLDREVVNHQPLRIRREGRISDRQPLVMIGYPVGLPAKVTSGAAVRSNDNPHFFECNLDAYFGNSGSAVFDAQSLQVEGLLARGEPDEFVRTAENCFLSRVCPDDGCRGEDVVRSTEFAPFIPRVAGLSSYKVFFGSCDALELLGELDLLGETAERSWRIEGLEPGETYCWFVEQSNGCGTLRSEVWQFTTSEIASEPDFRRGDAFHDGIINLSDAITLLNFLFLGGDAPTCLSAADSDDSSDINLTDGVYLLNHLFLGGAAPPPPSTDCDRDPTRDALGCDSYRFCDDA